MLASDISMFVTCIISYSICCCHTGISQLIDKMQIKVMDTLGRLDKVNIYRVYSVTIKTNWIRFAMVK